MKGIILFIVFFICSLPGQTQSLDSILAEPQLIELKISTPQPRLNETFQITLDAHHLRANIFRSLIGKIEPVEQGIGETDNGQLNMNVKALKKGKNEIGPITFMLDRTRYTTNKIIYDVIEPLPKTDNGLWFRVVHTSDSMFCVIIEQRIPASLNTRESGNSISISTEPQSKEVVKFRNSFSIPGVHGGNSHAETNFSSVVKNGEESQFMYSYAVYYFEVVDRKASIIITKDKFVNIPAGYNFENLVVQ